MGVQTLIFSGSTDSHIQWEYRLSYSVGVQTLIHLDSLPSYIQYTTATGDVYMGEYDGGELQSKTQVDKEAMLSGTDETGRRIYIHMHAYRCICIETRRPC